MNKTNNNEQVLKNLGSLSIETFLREYWQKKPVLLKQAFPSFVSPLDANELAGLSLEEESQSRLIIESNGDWNTIHGPLDEEIFSTLPASNWSLLVQHVDALDPKVNNLLSQFRFLPNWRLDDIMISYASDKGGVGPHFDYYDVFLLQAEGKRRWRIGQRCNENSELVPDQAMKILAQFECEFDWEVEPGDLIYIPAKIAHWGEAIDESITYSIGFRAPSHSELLLDSTQHLNAELSEDQRYEDGDELLDLINSEHAQPGLIPRKAVERIQTELNSLVNNYDGLAHWLAEFSTQLKPGIQPESLPLEFASAEDCRAGKRLKLSPFCRSAHLDSTSEPACYINGQCYSMPLRLAEMLSSYSVIEPAVLTNSELEALIQLSEYSLIICADTEN